MRIRFIAKPNNGCDWHRLLLPFEKIEGDIKMGVHGDDETPELWEDCDVLIYNRNVQCTPGRLKELREAYGFKIIVDVDDYWVLPGIHPLHHYWNYHKYGELILENIKLADMVWVTNERLRLKVLPYNSNVHVVPNATPDTLVRKFASDKMRFIYAGTPTHVPDVKLLDGKFRRIYDEPFIRNNAQFVLAGYDAKAHTANWDSMRHVFEHTGCSRILPTLPIDKYMDHYSYADVSLVPLVDNEFNSCKSILKVLEAGAKGLPCIASAVEPYIDLYAAPGILWVYKPSDWLKHIRFCIKNPGWVKKAGLELREFVKEHYDLDEINQTRQRLLNEVANSSIYE